MESFREELIPRSPLLRATTSCRRLRRWLVNFGAGEENVCARILADTASMRSYISPDLADRLKLSRGGEGKNLYKITTFVGVSIKNFHEQSMDIDLLETCRHVFI